MRGYKNEWTGKHVGREVVRELSRCVSWWVIGWMDGLTKGSMDDEVCGLLGYYAASRGNCLPTFRDNVSVPSSQVKSPSFPVGLLTRQDVTDTLSRNVGKQLPHDST
jgi:hypothetical protein